MPTSSLPATASPRFVFLSLALALVFDLMPWTPGLPMPSLVAVMLVFWGMQPDQPISLSRAWVLGILLDVHQGVLLGHHPLVLCLLSFGAQALQRRLVGFSPLAKAAHALVLFFIAELVVSLLRTVTEGLGFSLLPLITVLLNGLSWLAVRPVVVWLLQRGRQPTDPKASARSASGL